MVNAKIIGVGAYVPNNIVNNEKLKDIVDTNDEWIRTRTGIERRHISLNEETSDLAAKASEIALSNSGINANDLDMIILATVTPDNFTPATACIVQKKIGAVNAAAVDINAACTGFIYGLKLANSLIKSGDYKNILVIGAETLSKVLNWEDRGTCVLFGDGAGATVVSATNDEDGIICVTANSNGEKGDVLTIGGIELKNPFNVDMNVPTNNNYIEMNGQEVFKFATSVMKESILDVVERGNRSLDNIKYVIPHQANLRIIDYTSKKLNMTLDRFIVNVQEYGNTSSASIPIALYEAYKEGKLNAGDEIVLVGFGGGLTWGAALIKW